MPTYWGIHNDSKHVDPLADNAVRVGWDRMGDLSQLEPTREAFVEAVRTAYPDALPSAPSFGGTLYRFTHGIEVGDIVVSPNRANRTLRIGEVTGPYQYRPDADLGAGRLDTGYEHWRPVKWLISEISRDEFSDAATSELSSATTLFTLRTARPEIERLVDGDPGSAAPDFSWVPFYEELGTKLTSFRDRRPELLELLWQAAKTSGEERLFTYLQPDLRDDGTFDPLTDIDPYTIYSPFNRGTTHQSRKNIAAAYRTVFGLTSPAPTAFDGIPIVNNQNSWFISWVDRRGDLEVPTLWDLLEAEIAYAEAPTTGTREALVAAFDEAARGYTRMLSMGVFWVRPNHYTAFDQRNVAFLTEQFPSLAERLHLGPQLTGEEFVYNNEVIGAWIASSDCPYTSRAELSYAAWMARPSDEGTDESGFGSSVSESSSAESVLADEIRTEYLVDNIVEDGSFIDIQRLQTVVDELRSQKNIILQGPPGTGKTWLARRLAWVLTGQRRSDRVSALQFHPSISYEDFVRGFRPNSDGRLELIDGPLLQLAARAAQDPEHNYVLVIEEINRGNPAQIFGEMLTLLEHDKRDADNALILAYPREGEAAFHLPPNLFLIGTMNVADRSLALVDMALRRRFSFFDLEPTFNDAWRQFVAELDYDEAILDVVATQMDELNAVIASDPTLGRDYQIGHSFFTPAEPAGPVETASLQWFTSVVDHKLAPLLTEYWFDRPELVRSRLQVLRQSVEQ